MKYLSDKTGVPEEHLKTLVDSGVISCSWVGYEEIYLHYKAIRPKHASIDATVSQVAVDKSVSRNTVYNIIHKFE